MRLHYIVALVVALIASSNGVSTIESDHATLSNMAPVDTSARDRPLAAAQASTVAKRSLRFRDRLSEDNEEESEERGLGSELKEVKFWWMLKNGMNPKKYLKVHGLEGLGENLHKHQKFKEYLDFSAYWRKNH